MRLTSDQYERRHENLVSGAYTVKPPNTERRGRQRVTSSCENCGRLTESLFDGFKAPEDSARAKFYVEGIAVRLSAEGRKAWRRGPAYLEKFGKEPNIIRVRQYGHAQGEYFHMDFWELAEEPPANVRTAIDEQLRTLPGRVCQRCRPPSNLEVEEMLKESSLSRKGQRC